MELTAPAQSPEGPWRLLPAFSMTHPREEGRTRSLQGTERGRRERGHSPSPDQFPPGLLSSSPRGRSWWGSGRWVQRRGAASTETGGCVLSGLQPLGSEPWLWPRGPPSLCTRDLTPQVSLFPGQPLCLSFCPSQRH